MENVKSTYDNRCEYSSITNIVLKPSGHGNNIYDLLENSFERISKSVNSINTYIKLKEKYEQFLFSGSIEKAEMILNEIDCIECCSIWSWQQRNLLYNISSRNDYIGEKILKPVGLAKDTHHTPVSLLLYFLTQQTDLNIRYSSYLENVEVLLRSIPHENNIHNYFSYKLRIDQNPNIHCIKAALEYDAQISLIDHYESFVEALIWIRTERYNLFGILKHIVHSLYSSIDDFRIRNLYISLIDPSANSINSTVAKIMELYTRGRYSSLKESWNKQLPYNDDFNICKTLVKANVSVPTDMYVATDFWKEMEHIYSCTHKIEESRQRICEYYKLLYCTSWRTKICCALSLKLNYLYSGDTLKTAILHDKYLTPLFFQCIDNIENQKKYIDLFKQSAPVTHSLHSYLIGGEKNKKLLDLVEQGRKDYYELKYLFQTGQYTPCIDKANEILASHNRYSLYYQERTRRVLFNCFMSGANYLQAMKVYVDAYSKGEALNSHMNLEELVNNVKSTYDMELCGSIFRPIVLNIYYKNQAAEIISCYLDFIESTGATTIIDYIDSLVDIDDNQEIFLSEVCTTNLLVRDYVSKTDLKLSAQELRIFILQKLLSCRRADYKKYIPELNKILRNIQLESKLETFNHNRIYIDKEHLITLLNKNLATEFRQFLIVQDLHFGKTDQDSIGFFIDDYYDQRIFAKKMVEQIMDAYLMNSPYSLESFLGTRIRHSFSGEKLKEAFEKMQLFSKKDTDASDVYLVNEYWKNKIASDEFILVSRVLSDFSKKVDQKINEVNRDWLRIRSEQHPNGMFDYTNFVNWFMNQIDSVISDILVHPYKFIRFTVLMLDQWTSTILDKVKVRIDQEIPSYYADALLEMQNQTEKLLIKKATKNDLLRRIEFSRAKYVECVQNFKDSFNLRHQTYVDFTMSELIDFTLKLQSKINKDFEKISCSVNCECKERFSGAVFPYLVDIMDILIKNAIQHSEIKHLDDLEIEIEITHAKDSPFVQKMEDEKGCVIDANLNIIIHVKNNLSESVNINDTDKIMDEILSNIESGNFLQKNLTEGRSGLYKIARTIKYNIIANSIFYYNVKDLGFDLYLIIDLNEYIIKDVC